MKSRIAFFILKVESLSGGNGAERFFADLYTFYKNQNYPKYNLYFITDSLENYKLIGKFTEPDTNIIFLNYTHKWFKNTYPGKPVLVRKFLRLLILLMAYAELFYKILKNRINIIHLCLYIKFDYPFVKFIDSLPSFMRPKIVLNMVDCSVPYYYFIDEPYTIKTSAHRFHHEKLFNHVHIDAVYSWYEKVKEFLEENRLIKSNPPITCITSRFVLNHATHINGPKEKSIVWAARLIDTKKPMMYVDAIHLLMNKNIPAVKEWKFKLYGRGYLEDQVSAALKEYELEGLVEQTFHKNMGEVFALSQCFVSTQDFENFPSMSMAEAMINRNTIIARNVGQTALFVKNGVNGILFEPDTAEGLCNALEDFIVNNENYNDFGNESLKLMQTVHTPENFVVQIDSFWETVLKSKNK